VQKVDAEPKGPWASQAGGGRHREGEVGLQEQEAEPAEPWPPEARWAQASRAGAVSLERLMPSGPEAAAERKGAESELWPFSELHSKSRDSPERWIHEAVRPPHLGVRAE
jgi:hypothetical protein